MTGLGIEYYPCIKCDKTKCSFCELTRYKNSQYERGDAERSKTNFVEFVRCKDCVNERHCQFTQYQGEMGYCSLGERKDGADE